MLPLVDTPSVALSRLLVDRPLWQRPCVLPYTVVYPVFLHFYLNHYDTYFVGQEWTFVYLVTIFLSNALLALMPNWLIDVRTKFNYIGASSVDTATSIQVIAAPNAGVSLICRLDRELYGSLIQTSFLYQKRRFLYHPEKQHFLPPEFAVDNTPLIASLRALQGISGLLTHLYRVYGHNKFDIPVPSFLELFQEHAVAPFFVFQIFSVALWCMDEFWYYLLFTLFMLVLFECTTVFQRRSTLTEFQTMGIKPYTVYAHRNGAWGEVQLDELLPGDVVLVTRTADDLALPCDLVLLGGSAIVNEAMLSGELTPLLKELIALRPGEDEYAPEGLDKNLVLHGGTSALQVLPPDAGSTTVSPPPDNGAVALVAKTGFETLQGLLVRMMIFSLERVLVGNAEAMYFLLFLLVFAVIALWYVWVEGTKMGRIHSKLILDCIIIITLVVPPELPMELTMAVNLLLSALGKFYIYCTEPFRIPMAGRIDVCCFDKTGTLTGEDLVFEGLAGFHPANVRHLSPCSDPAVPHTTLLVLGAAHALVRLDDGEVVGDPMEQATLSAAGWLLSATTKDIVEKLAPAEKAEFGKPAPAAPKVLERIHILRRFQFSLALKRSLSIALYGNGKTIVLVKGAPETIREMVVDAPANYDDVYKLFTRSGSRVLALAYKLLEDNIPAKRVTLISRDKVELGLKFAGFIVFHCPLKEDATETVQMLNESLHRCVMITGDNPLTAVHVAKQVGIVLREVMILDAPEHGGEGLVWRNVEETRVEHVETAAAISDLVLAGSDLCITGYALAKLVEHERIRDLIKHTWVFARVLPLQKEYLLNTYKDLGYKTLMCGDGTNDVGALKQAHIGVALLNGTEAGMKKIAEQRKIDAVTKLYAKQTELMARWNRPPPPVPAAIAHLHPPGPLNKHYLSALAKQGVEITPEIEKAVHEANRQAPDATISGGPGSGAALIGEQLLALMEEQNEELEAPTLKLGDALVAAPFTLKLASVLAVTNIVRQGRCALVLTIQMYKILALNCLISAYLLLVIYLAGVKFGDGQATVLGILVLVCFLLILKGKPIQKLLKERPQPGIFNVYIMGLILGQFAVHITTLVYITREIYIREPREPLVDLEKEFAPLLLNTGIFLLQLAQQVLTFAVNYQGRPFRESISENRGMYWGLIGVTALAFAGLTEYIPELNEAMKFVKMDDEFKFKLTGCLVADLGVCWAIESVLKYFFSDFKAADIAWRE